MKTVIDIDFETRSRCDIRTHGAWVYSEDDSTEILCVSYSINGAPVKTSHPAFASGISAQNWPPKDLLSAIKNADELEVWAHNVTFERAIWKNICHGRLSWVEIPHASWRCTMAVAAYYALPMSLEGCANALNLKIKKDMVGSKAMLRCCKPTKTGAWHEDKEDLLATFAYCPVDVEVAMAIRERLGELPAYELAIWQADQEMNARGVPIDLKLADTAIEIAEQEKAKANLKLYELTGGQVKSTTGRNDFFDWTLSNFFIDSSKMSLAKGEIPKLLSDSILPDDIKKAITLKSSAGKASVSKYTAMAKLTCKDSRFRGGFAYFGAGTGRWAGRGIQLQNFPRGYKKEMDAICEALLEDAEKAADLSGDSPLDTLKKAARGAICAPEGKELVLADYSSIEARGVMWLAEDDDALKVLTENCIYCDMATAIYGFTVNKKEHPQERQLGKQAILGCGYGMGYIKFLITLQGYNIRLGKELVETLVGDKYDELKAIVIADAVRIKEAGLSLKEHGVELIGAKFIVDTYRQKYNKVRSLWYDTERAAVEAMQNPGAPSPVTKLYYIYEDDFLKCFLPSGRAINYYRPGLETVYSYTFYAKHPKNGKLLKLSTERKEPLDIAEFEVELKRTRGLELSDREPIIRKNEKLFYYKAERGGSLKKTYTYSGKLVENNVQAICRDLVAEALVRAEKDGLNPILTVHDELGIENDIGKVDVNFFENYISELPEWAKGFPVAAEGFKCKRYRKD